MAKKDKWLTINYLNGVSESFYVENQCGDFIFYHNSYFDFQYISNDKIIEMSVPYCNIKNFTIEWVA